MENQKGYTDSERFLGVMCRKSFLSIWSHQNLYTDRGRNDINKQGKELCDLLVIFGNDIIIFSDKQCSYPESGNENTDWSRWYKKTIKDSANQIFGAEKWIKEHPKRIFLDKLCQEVFPYEIPSPADMRIHRVAIALGAGKRVASHFGGGSSGSLMLHGHLTGDAHIGPEAKPFCVGHVDRDRFVHVFDDISLPIILEELDTIYDFVDYLKAKESFLKLSKYVFIPGEEDFLAFYLDSTLQHKQFPPPEIQKAIAVGNAGSLQITEGFWEDFQNGPLSKIRREVRKASAFYDALIEHFAGHLKASSLAYAEDAEYRTHERNLRFLAAEPRDSRCALTLAWQKKLLTTPANVRTSISVSSDWTGCLIILVLFPQSRGQSEKNYRKERQAALTAYAFVAKHKYPKHRFVVCLGIQPGPLRVRRSEDLMSFDFQDWSDKDDLAAKAIQAEFNILTDIEQRGTFDPPNVRRGDLGGGNRAERRRKQSIAKKGRPP